MVDWNLRSLEAPTEPVTERSTRPPEHLDRLDPAIRSMVGLHDLAVVRHPQDRLSVDEMSGYGCSHASRNAHYQGAIRRRLHRVEDCTDAKCKRRYE